MTDNATPSGSGNRFYTQDEVDALFNRVVNVNVSQSQSTPLSALDVYPGIGLWHLFHLAMSLFVVPILWIVVWVAHVVIARRKWEREREARQQQEDRS